ncbi:MAG: hypothetical protein HQK95_04155 [Nitrospirae bacterium]|nr:hypothetical protein [Nitrospirota bacterium]
MTKRDKDDNNLSNYRLLMMENKFAVDRGTPLIHYNIGAKEISYRTESHRQLLLE